MITLQICKDKVLYKISKFACIRVTFILIIFQTNYSWGNIFGTRISHFAKSNLIISEMCNVNYSLYSWEIQPYLEYICATQPDTHKVEECVDPHGLIEKSFATVFQVPIKLKNWKKFPMLFRNYILGSLIVFHTLLQILTEILHV